MLGKSGCDLVDAAVKTQRAHRCEEMKPSDLMKPPFDRPATFIKLFDDGKRRKLVQLINQVKNNAIIPAA